MHPKLCRGSAQKGACGILCDACDRACMWPCVWFHSRSGERGLAQGARQNARKGAAARQGPAGVGIWLPRLWVHLQREIVTARRPNHKTTARAGSTSASTVTAPARAAVQSRVRREQREVERLGGKPERRAHKQHQKLSAERPSHGCVGPVMITSDGPSLVANRSASMREHLASQGHDAG
jgi:hypothetical protein